MKWKNFIPPDSPINLIVEGNDSSRVLRWSRPVINIDSIINYVVYRFKDDEKIDLNNPKNIINVIYRQSFFSDNNIMDDVHKVTYVVTSLSDKQMESSNYAEASIKIKNDIKK